MTTKENLTPEELAQLAVLAKGRDENSIIALIRHLRPFIDRVIKKLGVFPSNRFICGMDYDELLSDAHTLLIFRIIPGYDPQKGNFLHYARKYLSKEIPKRLYRARERLKREIPFCKLEDWGSCSKNRENLQIHNAEISLSIGRALENTTPAERKILKDVFSHGRFIPVRQKAARINASPTTIWRRRKALQAKITSYL